MWSTAGDVCAEYGEMYEEAFTAMGVARPASKPIDARSATNRQQNTTATRSSQESIKIREIPSAGLSELCAIAVFDAAPIVAS